MHALHILHDVVLRLDRSVFVVHRNGCAEIRIPEPNISFPSIDKRFDGMYSPNAYAILDSFHKNSGVE